jgi:A/G-specific adenine glycosylase
LIEIRRKEFSEKLLEWWQGNRQDFPWRKTRNPYSILVAELLLRKTTSKQVEKMYKEFLNVYPSPKELSKASEDDLRKHLTPLGMEHIRARLFIKLADAILKNFNGQIPDSEESLRELSGVGRYSANAVLCMAYGKHAPMVDTNVVRVVQRVFSFKSSKARVKDDPSIWSFVKGLIPQHEAKNFNLAIIDFAHSVCLLRKPLCCSCSLRSICDYGKKQIC